MTDYMINGLDLFADKMKDYSKNYIIVGGTACYLALANAGISFRVTNDIDMIVITEELTTSFGRAFWSFINEGGYECWKADEQTHFFRFYNPRDKRYPKMIELFSRKQDLESTNINGKYTKIVVGEEISSLSAILLDDSYYQFLKSGSEVINGLPILKPEYLIAFKARAHVDLNKKHIAGLHVNERDLKKHKRDIFRLVQLLNPSERIEVNSDVKNDLQMFFDLVTINPVDTKALNLGFSQEEAINILKEIFQIG